MRLFAAALLALALCACSRPAETESAAPGESPAASDFEFGFPQLYQTAYRAEIRVMSANESATFVFYRDGENFRFESEGGGQGPAAFLHRAESDETYMLMQRGGKTMAMRIPAGSDMAPKAPEAGWADRADVTPGGPCEAAGERGREFSSNADGKMVTACVTKDGIPLWSAVDGARVFEAVSVARGPQAESLFRLPDDAAIMDLPAIALGGGPR